MNVHELLMNSVAWIHGQFVIIRDNKKCHECPRIIHEFCSLDSWSIRDNS